MVSLNRLQKLVKVMINEVIAESNLIKFLGRLYQALKVCELDAIEPLLKAPAIKVDETSLGVVKLNHWLYVFSAGDITLKFLHRREVRIR
jgi:transposase